MGLEVNSQQTIYDSICNFLGPSVYLPSDETFFGSKSPQLNSLADSFKKNSSGVWNLIPMLSANLRSPHE
jgi:hypothetical protein